MTTKLIIGINGVKGSGKDTLADYLVAHHDFKKLSFADPLKRMAQLAFPFTDEQLWGPSKKREEPLLDYPFSGTCPTCRVKCNILFLVDPGEENPMWWKCVKCSRTYEKYITARLALTSLGEEWGRGLYERLWTRAGLRAALEDPHPRWVFPDARYRSEISEISSRGGRLIRLLRRWDAPRLNHASETEMLTVPHTHFDLVLPDTSIDEVQRLMTGTIAEWL